MGRSKASASNREFLPFVVSLGAVNMLGLRQGRMDDAEFVAFELQKSGQVASSSVGHELEGLFREQRARLAESATMTAVTGNKNLECQHEPVAIACFGNGSLVRVSHDPYQHGVRRCGRNQKLHNVRQELAQ